MPQPEELSTLLVDMNGYLYDIRRPGKNIIGLRSIFGAGVAPILNNDTDLHTFEIFNRMQGKDFNPNEWMEE